MNQTTLINQCKEGNRLAQMQLYDSYAEGMYRIAMRYVNDEFVAEDLVQESFIKLFKNLKDFKGEVSIGAYLKRIVVNHSIDFLKKKRIETMSYREEIGQPIDESGTWELEKEISREHVLEVIDQIKHKYQVVLKLYLIEGFDHAEIAQILSITEVLSRTHLMRGRKQLKEQLKDYYYA